MKTLLSFIVLAGAAVALIMIHRRPPESVSPKLDLRENPKPLPVLGLEAKAQAMPLGPVTVWA